MQTDRNQPDAQEFQGMPHWERSFWLSRAYMEASVCLCKAMLTDEFSSQYSSSRVILHLARQGIELFLKGAILSATQAPSGAGHNLDRLLTEYREYSPGDRFHFKLPTALSLREELDLFPREVQSYHSTLDQRHRYPTDLKGRDFASPEGFEPMQIVKVIESLAQKLIVIEIVEIGSLGRPVR